MAAVYDTAIKKHFPGAIKQSEMLRKASKVISSQGYKKILFATSCCPDEIKRDLDNESLWGRPFCMGGLSGFPFTGKTGFIAYMHHAPADGAMFVICASHIGVNQQGKFGRVMRVDMKKETRACGSAIRAYKYINENPTKLEGIIKRDKSVYPGFGDPMDAQQNYVLHYVATRYKEIKAAVASGEDAMVKLSKVVAERIHEDLMSVIPNEVECPVIVLSGVQINIEDEAEREGEIMDYFVPTHFEILTNDGPRPLSLDAFKP